jgi:hypothetical protein
LRKARANKDGGGTSTDVAWTPNPGPQTLALESEADELFYGGAAGGGKTDLLLGVAGTRHKHSIVFRRIFPSMRNIIERSREIYNTRNSTHARDSYNESLHVWRLLNGRMVEFGAMQYEKNKEDYRGRPHDLYGWDELPEFTESQFRFVNAWNRSTDPGQRCRVIATGNPPTSSEGQWVIKYWAPWLDPNHPNPAEPGELRWFAVLPREDGGSEDVEVDGPTPFEHDGELITPRSRTFIPARLADNPQLERTGYRATLQGLPEPLRSQMLYGDFSLSVDDNPWQVIPTEWVRMAQDRWKARERPTSPMSCLGVDVARGGKDKTVLSARYDNWFAPLEKYPGKETPTGQSVAALTIKALGGQGAPVNIDAIGVGTSPLDILRENGVAVYPINNAESADLKDKEGHVIEEARDKSRKFKLRNVRATSYWRLREALDPENGDELALPPDPELLADLCAPRWSLSAGGIIVESKEEIAKPDRLGRSPDCGDAVVLAHYLPPILPEEIIPTVSAAGMTGRSTWRNG